MRLPWIKKDRSKGQAASAGFEFSGPMRHADYRDHLAQAAHNPLVHVELTSKCNFHCAYCISPNSPRTKGFMKRELFEHICHIIG